jgi:hypothetical protein
LKRKEGKNEEKEEDKEKEKGLMRCCTLLNMKPGIRQDTR